MGRSLYLEERSGLERFPGLALLVPGGTMNCETCGHDWFEHDRPGYAVESGLCQECFYAPHGGPCYPWEFR